MTHSAMTPLLGREFDRFLFASVGEERNGMALSVLSALARLDLDPWDEAIALTRLSKDQAKARLAALLASTTRKLPENPPTETVAARLVALLPSAPTFTAPSFATRVKPPAARTSRFMLALGLIASLFVCYAVFSSHRSPEADLAPTVGAGAASLPR